MKHRKALKATNEAEKDLQESSMTETKELAGAEGSCTDRSELRGKTVGPDSPKSGGRHSEGNADGEPPKKIRMWMPRKRKGNVHRTGKKPIPLQGGNTEPQVAPNAHPDAIEAKVERAKQTTRWLYDFAFDAWVTVQPNAARSRLGQTLEEAWSKMMMHATCYAYGNDSTNEANRHKGIQGVVFFEGAIDDHAHAFAYSDYETSEPELKRAYERAFLPYFKKGTVDVQLFDGQSRKSRINYIRKELYKSERFDQFVIFGPHPSLPTISIPLIGEDREREWKGRYLTDPIPEIETFTDLDLRQLLLRAWQRGDWKGPHPAAMRTRKELVDALMTFARKKRQG